MQGQTVLMSILAESKTEQKHLRVAELLIQGGADINKADKVHIYLRSSY